MNKNILKSYIEKYKQNFDRIHDKEIYKWKAIKQFQDNFNIEAKNLHSNLEIALESADNLLGSKLYFPKILLLENIEKSPEQIRKMIHSLYDEEVNVLSRIENFRSEFKSLSKSIFPNKKNHFQDHRAIMVYLTLMYPERYFFYKFGMFTKFSKKISFHYTPKKGKVENIGHYQSLCKLVRYDLINDQDLLKLHKNRLTEDCYIDKNYNVLTQDFIYAVDVHLQELALNKIQKSIVKKSTNVNSADLELKDSQLDFTPRIVNYAQKNELNKRIGDLGEIWVLEYEKKFLEDNGKTTLAKKVTHVAKADGDGLGYDILSFDLAGNKKYIEVKTTKGKKNSAFYVTRNELEKSKIADKNYFLYRVYEYDEDNGLAELMIIKGNLSKICELPITYKVNLK